MYIMNGAEDTVMDIPHHLQPWFDDIRARAATILGPNNPANKNLFTTVFYPGVSHRPIMGGSRDAALWLNSQLHFALWTDAQINALPTAKVSDWAAKNSVAVTASDMRDTREGGIDALDLNLPNIPRADLMVLPDADWQAMKDQLTYEAWAAKASAAEAVMAAAATTSHPSN